MFLSIILSALLVFTPSTINPWKIRKMKNKKTPPGTVWLKDIKYFDATEVTNLDWREYLYWTKENDKDNYSKVFPDTTVWRTKGDYLKPFINLYLTHPSYGHYPIVGVSHEQAIEYCKWRSDRVNESIYKKIHKLDILQKINTDTIPKYVRYRLPTEEEWEFAAKGGLKGVPFPWGGMAMQNSKGCYLCNFNKIGEANIILSNDTASKYVVANDMLPNFSYKLSDKGTITAPVTSYEPNNYGIYNMSGNVAEMISIKGISKGGSWKLPGYYCRIDKQFTYTKPTNDIGFRCICDRLIKWD